MRAESNGKGVVFSWDVEVLVVILFGFLALFAGLVITHYDTESKVTKIRCEEDMPCWNCHTMGNHICGKVQVHK